MLKKLLNTRSLCLSALIAALYVALTLLLAPISYGNIQCRVAEALTVLPLLMPQAIPGLFVGCLIANLFTGMMTDVIFGSLATLLAGVSTCLLRKRRWMAACCPVVFNGIIVGWTLAISSGLPVALTMGQVALGEVAAVALGMGVLLPALKNVRIDLHG